MKAIALLAVTLLAGNASASTEESINEKCALFGELGFVIMDLRQNGYPLHKAIKEANSSTEKYLTMAAYDVPVKSNDGLKNKASIEFSSEMTMKCLSVAPKIVNK